MGEENTAFEHPSKPEQLPVRCECGWVLPAGFQIISPDEHATYATGSMLLFACGNCGCWRNIMLGRRGGAITPNAAGFSNMPSRDRTAP